MSNSAGSAVGEKVFSGWLAVLRTARNLNHARFRIDDAARS